MENILEMFKLLEDKTSEKGEFSLHFNDHKGSYCDDPKKYYCLDEEDYKHVDWTKDIYKLYWYKDTPVGSYDFMANTLEDIAKQVLKHFKE